MADFKELFRTAVAVSMDTRGKPALLGKVDGSLYFSSSRRDMVWARIGEEASNQEVVVRCTSVAPQFDMPVRVDHVNGILTVVSIDESRFLKFSGNRPGGATGAHAWLHGRLGPDPMYITGLQYLPLLVVPSNPAALTVDVKQGAYRWDGDYNIFEEATSGSLSGYVPGSSAVKHFVIICLDRSTNTIVIVDGDDLSTMSGDALFGSVMVTVADVLAVTIADAYYPLAAVLLYYGQTEVRAADIVMDLRPWGADDFGGGVVIPEPPDDAATYGRKTDGTSSWVAVVPAAGGQFTGDVGIGVSPSYTLDVAGEFNVAKSGRGLLYDTDGFGSYLTAYITSTGFLAGMDIIGSEIDFQIGDPSGSSGTSLLNLVYSSGNKIGFFNNAAVAQQTAVLPSTALENFGLGVSLLDEMPTTGGTFTGAVGISSGGLTVEGGAVFNESGADVDHRFEGDTDANLLFVDASTDRVGVGTNTPSKKFHVNGDSLFAGDAYIYDATDPTLYLAEGSSTTSYLRFIDNSTSQATIQKRNLSGQAFIDIDPTPADGTSQAFFRFFRSTNTTGGAFITVYIGQNSTTQNAVIAGSGVDSFVCANNGDFGVGTNTPTSRLHVVGGGVQVGSPTGGDKGAGTINTAGDIYKNNSAYTNPDYVLEKYFTGHIVKHAEAANQNYYTDTIPLNKLESYLRDNWHLPNRSNETLGIFGRADWVQEKLEEMALYICQLHKRIEVLENG